MMSESEKSFDHHFARPMSIEQPIEQFKISSSRLIRLSRLLDCAHARVGTLNLEQSKYPSELPSQADARLVFAERQKPQDPIRERLTLRVTHENFDGREFSLAYWVLISI